MRIAIASGKGGTGKTTVATSLAAALAADGKSVAYLDCDVEAPNGAIFLDPAVQEEREVPVPVPEIDEARCIGCGACAAVCRFAALVALERKVLTFPKLCHSCGACVASCPQGAIREVPRPVGTLRRGTAGGAAFVEGRLSPGEPMAPPVVRAALRAAPPAATTIVDCPPGTGCPVVTSLRGADVALLVTEPTPFGLHDLKLAIDLVTSLGIPFAVLVNQADVGDREVFSHCAAAGIEIAAEIPYDRRIAESYSRGELAIRAIPDLMPLFVQLARRLRALAAAGAPRPPAAPPPASAPAPAEPRARQRLVTIGSGTRPRELVVVSGKGGTGKTTIVASLAALAGNAVLADCDVDAPDLHLILKPEIGWRSPFFGGERAIVDGSVCAGCGACIDLCRSGALRWAEGDGRPIVAVDPLLCEGCGVCASLACPVGAVRLAPARAGEWFTSETRFGPMVHAGLRPGGETSGKLVALVREEARAIAQAKGRDLIIVDGPPGIGCPVIATLSGAHLALVVTEPTRSALEDMKRVLEVARHFGVAAAVCINKADLNPRMANRIAAEAAKLEVPLLGGIRYDPAVIRAEAQGRAAVEQGGEGAAAHDIRSLWKRLAGEIGAARRREPVFKVGRRRINVEKEGRP